MLRFSDFLHTLSESFTHGYKASEEQFNDLYGNHKLVKDGLATHVYNNLKDKIATYNHEMGVLSTNRVHADLEKV